MHTSMSGWSHSLRMHTFSLNSCFQFSFFPFWICNARLAEIIRIKYTILAYDMHMQIIILNCIYDVIECTSQKRLKFSRGYCIWHDDVVVGGGAVYVTHTHIKCHEIAIIFIHWWSRCICAFDSGRFIVFYAWRAWSLLAILFSIPFRQRSLSTTIVISIGLHRNAGRNTSMHMCNVQKLRIIGACQLCLCVFIVLWRSARVYNRCMTCRNSVAVEQHCWSTKSMEHELQFANACEHRMYVEFAIINGARRFFLDQQGTNQANGDLPLNVQQSANINRRDLAEFRNFDHRNFGEMRP